MSSFNFALIKAHNVGLNRACIGQCRTKIGFLDTKVDRIGFFGKIGIHMHMVGT